MNNLDKNFKECIDVLLFFINNRGKSFNMCKLIKTFDIDQRRLQYYIKKLEELKFLECTLDNFLITAYQLNASDVSVNKLELMYELFKIKFGE